MTAPRRRALSLLAGLLPALAAAQLRDGGDPAAVEIWQKLRASLFAGRPINPDTGRVIRLDAPARAIPTSSNRR